MKKRVQKITAFVMALAIMFVTLSTLSPPITVEAATEFNEIVCVSGTTVNVRSGPGTSYSRVGLAAKYSMYEYISSSGNWHQIQFGSQKAWISASYAKRSYEVNGYNIRITGTTVNIRNGPGTNFTRVGRLTAAGNVYPCHAKMTSVDGCLWYNIDFGSTNAWVLGSLAKLVAAPTTTVTTTTTTAAPVTTTTTTTTPTTAPTTPTVTTKTVIKVTGSTVNVRSGAGVSYSKIGLAYAGDTYTYLGEAKNGNTTWYKIQFTSSTVGWISGTYSDKIVAAVSDTPSTRTIITITGNTVNVRKGAGTSYNKVGLACAGSTYTYLGEAKNGSTTWYKIQFSSSTVGWVSGSYSEKSIVTVDNPSESTITTTTTTAVAPTATTTEQTTSSTTEAFSATTTTVVATTTSTTTTAVPTTESAATTTTVTMTESTTIPTTTSSTVPVTTTTKATTTRVAPTTTTTTATSATTTITTTTTAPTGRWVSQSEMNRILANVRAHAESIGMHWDTTLNKDTAMWGTATQVETTAYKTATAYEDRVKGKISYYYNKNIGYEYVNVIITSAGNGEYTMTCYFG